MRTVLTPDRKVVVLNDDGTWKYASPSAPIVEKLKSLLPSPEIIAMFEGLFETLGVQVTDTGETFTCHHRGDHIEFQTCLDPKAVDFTVEIYAFQLERLAEHVARGQIDDVEQFRVARELFSSVSKGKANILENPLMSNPLLRWLIRGKNLVHVHQLSPDPEQEPDATFTLIHFNGRWLVIPGLHGKAKRVFRVSIANALELQKCLFQSMKANSLWGWIKTARWYTKWRRKVEVPL